MKLLPENCRLMAVVKADAYGHGAVEAAREFWKAGVRTFAVATLAEGMALRRGGILVRHFEGERTADFVRVTVGTDRQMQALVDTSKNILREVHA